MSFLKKFCLAFFCFCSSMIASDYHFVQSTEHLKQAQIFELTTSNNSSMSDFLAEVNTIAQDNNLGNKYVLLSPHLENKNNFLGDDKLKVGKNAVVVELLTDNRYRFSVLIEPCMRIANIDENGELTIEDIKSSASINYVLCCEGEDCRAMEIKRHEDNTWQKVRDLDNAMVEAFKLEMRSMFWIIN